MRWRPPQLFRGVHSASATSSANAGVQNAGVANGDASEIKQLVVEASSTHEPFARVEMCGPEVVATLREAHRCVMTTLAGSGTSEGKTSANAALSEVLARLSDSVARRVSELQGQRAELALMGSATPEQ